ncbi:hypothetical protein DOM21_04310 [Bacteriovorax stolpii]|uniref:Uncharacterized protein n=1 Tax=Bacteriovorax stolpii TaxID=960 RepID=A0A2K9NUY4_BACTC|nr:hypothetical protein [Bacteriovorax stolpii]AUN99331.1 hypothetical protein C0V70_14695 [Bacteriovorax stolpii]QDK40689.1 hypothetical protein DOM21_04310 [Bacteriovorax stolpii]TDP55129.1 hypothetical protein C8D79_0172 [Bacteriovorax stolpii]
MKVRFFSILAMLLALTSCAGYHFNTNNNPLIGYDIRSVAVPMFVNRSVIPELAAPMTKEIIFTLNDYSGLRVFSGENEAADAVLIGIIESRDHYNDAVKTTQTLFTDDTIKSSVGDRSPFYYPVQTTYRFSLKVYLIKRPSKEEIQLLTTDMGQFMKANPKVVLMDTIDLSGSFSRAVGETTTANAVGKTNFVKNKGVFEKSLQDTAISAAKTFRQVVLNAF